MSSAIVPFLTLVLAGAEPAVTPIDAATLAGRIDHHIAQRLEAEQQKPASRADDAEFLRRVYLDITGVIPPPDKAKAFLDNKDPNKRAKLIDELLESPDYGRHMADLWDNLLIPRNSDNLRLQVGPFTKWLQEGRPLSTEPATTPAVTFTPRAGSPEILVTAERVLEATADPGATVLDVRRRTEFTGEEARAARGGRVLGRSGLWMIAAVLLGVYLVTLLIVAAAR